MTTPRFSIAASVAAYQRGSAVLPTSGARLTLSAGGLTVAAGGQVVQGEATDAIDERLFDVAMAEARRMPVELSPAEWAELRAASAEIQEQDGHPTENVRAFRAETERVLAASTKHLTKEHK